MFWLVNILDGRLHIAIGILVAIRWIACQMKFERCYKRDDVEIAHSCGSLVGPF